MLNPAMWINLSVLVAKKTNFKKSLGMISLAEVILWLGIISVIMGISFKIMFRKKPLDNFPSLISELSNLSLLTEQKAISNGSIVALKIYQINNGGLMASIEEFPNVDLLAENTDLSRPNSKKNTSASDIFLPSKINVDTSISVEAIDVTDNNNNKNQPIVIHFFPSGGCDALKLKLKRQDKDKVVEIKISLNPFLCTFTKDEDDENHEKSLP